MSKCRGRKSMSIIGEVVNLIKSRHRRNKSAASNVEKDPFARKHLAVDAHTALAIEASMTTNELNAVHTFAPSRHTFIGLP